jgi:hypothetical protein
MTAHGKMVLCGQRTGSIYSTKICKEPFGSDKVELTHSERIGIKTTTDLTGAFV